MARSPIVVRAACVCLVGVMLAACMALPKPDRAMFQEPPLPNRGTLPLKAGLLTLTDARPAAERQSFVDIEDFPDRLTLELLMDLSEARLFSVIGKDTTGAELLLRGKIQSFQWAPRYDRVPYVPGLAFLAALGVPVAHSASEVQLTLDLVHPKTEQVIASYTKAAASRQSYWVYRYQDWSAGSDRDLDSAYRRVVDGLQSAIVADRERIVAAVK